MAHIVRDARCSVILSNEYLCSPQPVEVHWKFGKANISTNVDNTISGTKLTKASLQLLSCNLQLVSQIFLAATNTLEAMTLHLGALRHVIQRKAASRRNLDFLDTVYEVMNKSECACM